MKTILLVEDKPNQQALYKMELEDEGFRVVLASRGWEALRKVEEGGVDLVVLDLGMPDMDGIEVLARLVRANTGMPIIIYSGYEEFRHTDLTQAADAYLVKCSDLDLLKAEIRRVLQER